MGPYQFSGEQLVAAQAILDEVSPICRLNPNMTVGKGRGIQTLFNLVSTQYETEKEGEVCDVNKLVSQLAETARDVQVERMGFACPAGET